MKTLLIVLLIGICGLAWRSDELAAMIGMSKGTQSQNSELIQMMPPAPTGMSLTEYADLAKKDPNAYRKLLESHQQKAERSDIDKLMNFFRTLRYE